MPHLGAEWRRATVRTWVPVAGASHKPVEQQAKPGQMLLYRGCDNSSCRAWTIAATRKGLTAASSAMRFKRSFPSLNIQSLILYVYSVKDPFVSRLTNISGSFVSPMITESNWLS